MRKWLNRKIEIKYIMVDLMWLSCALLQKKILKPKMSEIT